MRRVILIANVIFAAAFFAGAQTADEAFRYSDLRFGGSARGLGVAGAFGAMGADFTSVMSNPGGLGLYRKSEAMFSMGFDATVFETNYDGTRSRDDRLNFNIPNLGVVFSSKMKKSGKWKFANFALGYNRLANFHSDSYYRSASTSNSVLKSYAGELTGIPANEINYGGPYSLEATLAYDAYLINPRSDNNTLYTTVADPTTVNQQISMERRGAIDELSFAVGANYDDKIYFGGYLGIPFLNYRERIRHTERNNASDSFDFNSFELNQRLRTSGIGVNFKMGLIARPIDWLRLGAAFHSPTYFGLSDDFSVSLSSDFDTDRHLPPVQYSEFNFNLVTPARFVGSIGFVARKLAFVSFDYERVNYGNARYKMASEFNEFQRSLNDDIERLYSGANIFRAGVEFALDRFRLRTGYAHYGSPFKNDDIVGNFNNSINYVTFGAGFRLTRLYMDFAYVRGMSKAINLVVNDVLAQDNITASRFVLTTGFRF